MPLNRDNIGLLAHNNKANHACPTKFCLMKDRIARLWSENGLFTTWSLLSIPPRYCFWWSEGCEHKVVLAKTHLHESFITGNSYSGPITKCTFVLKLMGEFSWLLYTNVVITFSVYVSFSHNLWPQPNNLLTRIVVEVATSSPESLSSGVLTSATAIKLVKFTMLLQSKESGDKLTSNLVQNDS